jgi:acyl carrier protein
MLRAVRLEIACSPPVQQHLIRSSGADHVQDDRENTLSVPVHSETTQSGVEATVLKTVASVKRLPREQVSLDSSLADLGYDSLDTMNLLFEIEEEFKVSVPDQQAREIRSVREVVNGIEKLLAERPADSSAA